LLPTVYIVFSRRPQVVTEELSDRWDEAHVSQVLGAPGFAVAARYDLVPALDEPAEPDRYTSGAIYEIELSAPEAMGALAAELSSGRMDLPDWFGEIRFSSWLADPLGLREAQGHRLERPGTAAVVGQRSLCRVEPDPDRRAYRGSSRGTVGGEAGSALGAPGGGGLAGYVSASGRAGRRVVRRR